MQAIDHILELSISVPHIRQLLNELGASRELGLAFMGAQGIRDASSRTTLLNRARRALVAVSDVTVYGLGKQLDKIQSLDMTSAAISDDVDGMLKLMVSYLWYA